ncbi:unnamed protein product [Trifolium pratense]|uniref:Uncharacterized protein n=1 Tax=Trifolium pratense TaxID=57577 RepID=A0ACB0KEX0_TRIPR|nr:unnamed protein product [Trifolium pratense]
MHSCAEEDMMPRITSYSWLSQLPYFIAGFANTCHLSHLPALLAFSGWSQKCFANTTGSVAFSGLSQKLSANSTGSVAFSGLSQKLSANSTRILAFSGFL